MNSRDEVHSGKKNRIQVKSPSSGLDRQDDCDDEVGVTTDERVAVDRSYTSEHGTESRHYCITV